MAGQYTGALDYNPGIDQDELQQLLRLFRQQRGGGMLGQAAGAVAGIPSMNPLVAAGGAVIGGIGKLLTGDTWQEKAQKKLYSEGREELAKPGLNANNYYQGITDTAVRAAGKLAPQLQRKYGGGGGYGAALLDRTAEEAVPAVTNMQFGIDQYNDQRKLQLMRYLQGLTGGG